MAVMRPRCVVGEFAEGAELKMAGTREMLLALSVWIGCALPISVPATPARADVGVGVHVGGVGAGAHIGIGDGRYRHRHRYCSVYAWRHHYRYCRRWRR